VTELQSVVVSSGIGRADVREMLAGYGDRPLSAVGERIDSLELAWLIHQVEQRCAVTLDLSDEQLLQMSTVDGVVAVLHTTIGAGR
jgi:hypothetical protein